MDDISREMITISEEESSSKFEASDSKECANMQCPKRRPARTLRLFEIEKLGIIPACPG
jgi:hypothetical protein